MHYIRSVNVYITNKSLNGSDEEKLQNSCNHYLIIFLTDFIEVSSYLKET